MWIAVGSICKHGQYLYIAPLIYKSYFKYTAILNKTVDICEITYCVALSSINIMISFLSLDDS